MERNRITKLAFAIVIISFVLSTVVSLWSLGQMARDNTEELSKVLAARIYDTISSELSEPIIVSQTMAHDSFLIRTLREEDAYSEEEIAQIMGEYLSGIRHGLDYEAAFVVSQSSGRYYSYLGILKTIHPESEERDAWYSAFLNSGKEYDMDVDNDEVNHDAWTVFVDSRIEGEDGKVLGVCGVGVHMTRSRDLFYGLENQYQVKINLISADGLVEVDTDESKIEHVTLDGVRKSPSSDYVYQRVDRNRFIVTRYVDKLGWYLVVQSDGGGETRQFLNMVLMNAVLCALVLALLIIAVRIIMVRTRALTHASFRDHATSLLNRRAFEEEKERLQADALPVDFAYVTADVNGLKTANDTLGHVAGDELIKGAAECLKKCLGKYGKVYRIGGDEFAALLNVSPQQLTDAMDALEKAVAAWKGDKVTSLSLSCGHVLSREFPSEGIAQLSQISDERMYAAKEAYYRKAGIERRKT